MIAAFVSNCGKWCWSRGWKQKARQQRARFPFPLAAEPNATDPTLHRIPSERTPKIHK
jgi:hypothetical protein